MRNPFHPNTDNPIKISFDEAKCLRDFSSLWVKRVSNLRTPKGRPPAQSEFWFVHVINHFVCEQQISAEVADIGANQELSNRKETDAGR